MNDQPNNPTPPNKKQKTTPTQRRRKKKQNIDNAVIIALISALATVAVAFMGFQPLVNWLNSKLTPTPIVAITETITAVAVVTDTPSIEATLTIPPTPENTIIPFTPTLTFTPTIPTPTHTSTFTSVVPGSTSPQSPSDTMTVVLNANASQGKAPIAISFNAKDSYVQFADGTIIVCGNMHVCNYAWTVFRENKVVNTTTNNTGSFSYNFTGRGTYLVTVYACRGEACSGSGATISIR